VAAEDFTAALEADSTVARQEVSMVAAEVTMVTAADIPMPVTMEVATTVDTVVMAGMVVGMVATDGMADIGAIHTTVTDGAGDGVLALGGRIGVGDGDTRMATATALCITLPILTTTHMIVLRDTHVLPTGTMTLRLRIPAQSPGATQQSLGDHR
jgi:hypothetical protein